ncbi:MAG: MBL fold metallo-hydrolase [Caldilineaceae bacterium]|nr:MBL fold metallo-hydrolase [Caldilineaceae bacterium]
MIFMVTGEGVIVVDAPPTIGEKALAAIAEVTDEPITHVIYSHAHADHIGAAGIYPEDAVYIAQEETAARLAELGAGMANGSFPSASSLVVRPCPCPQKHSAII